MFPPRCGPFSWCWRATEVGAGLPAGGESCAPGFWRGAEMGHRQRQERWVGADQALLAQSRRPAVSGKQISWAMAGMTQMEAKEPSIFGQRARRGSDPQPTQAASPTPASCPVSHWAPGPEPCPRGLALRPQAALWHPPLSYQATFPVAGPGPWVLGNTQCWALSSGWRCREECWQGQDGGGVP